MTLIIYGIFENERCLKVGSTIRSLHSRLYGYRDYKWYDSSIHSSRVLWQGEVEDDEHLHFIRSVKEATWIGRMKTWKDEGGLNQMNPVLHALRNPNYFSELCAAGGRNCKGVPKRPHYRGPRGPFSEEHRKRLSLAHKGKHLSEEHKKKLSDALKGIPKPPYWRGPHWRKLEVPT